MLVRVEDARLRTWYQSSYKTREEEREMLQGVDQLNVMQRYGRTFLLILVYPLKWFILRIL